MVVSNCLRASLDASLNVTSFTSLGSEKDSCFALSMSDNLSHPDGVFRAEGGENRLEDYSL